MAAAPGLNDTFSEEGLWWIEGNEENQVGGTLTFDPNNGAELKLLGMLRDFATSMNASFKRGTFDSPTIYGVTVKGKPVTLMRTINSQRQMNLPGIPNEKWIANLVVIGIHLKSDKMDKLFSKSFFQFTGIERWIGYNPFDYSFDDDKKVINLRVEKLKEVELATHDDFKLVKVGSLYTENSPETNYSVSAPCDLAIIPSQPQSLDWHLSRASKIIELATICSGHPLAMTKLELKGPGERKIGDNLVHAQVQVYARMMHSDVGPPPKNHIPVVSVAELIKFNDLALQKWFDDYENLSSAIALLATVVSESSLYSNVRFSLAMQAIEVFHRRTSDDTILPTKDFEILQKSLVEAIPSRTKSNMREKMKGLYKYLNEPSLGQRLKAIISDLDSKFGTHPPAFDKAYIRKLVETRNYYTHFSEELEKTKLDGAGMHWATRRIILLLTMLFLERLGVNPADLLEHLERNNEFKRLLTDNSDPSK